MAIKVSVIYCMDNNISKVDLYTDSLAVLKTLYSLKAKNRTAEGIKCIVNNSKLDIMLHWAKSHCGVEGNEPADRKAKEAIMEDVIDKTVHKLRILLEQE